MSIVRRGGHLRELVRRIRLNPLRDRSVDCLEALRNSPHHLINTPGSHVTKGGIYMIRNNTAPIPIR